MLTAPATKVIKADARWTYSYANTIASPAGTYGGVNVHNSRVVYTASHALTQAQGAVPDSCMWHA